MFSCNSLNKGNEINKKKERKCLPFSKININAMLRSTQQLEYRIELW